jgi:transposase
MVTISENVAPLPAECPSRTTAQAQRRDNYQHVHQLHQQGVTILQIAKQLQMARKTVRRYLNAPVYPEWAARRPQPRHKIDPYLPYLRQRWEEGCQVAVTLWQEIVARGFTGSSNAVYRAIKRWRADASGNAPPTPHASPPSPRRVTWWLLDLIKPKTESAGEPALSRDDASPSARQHFVEELCRQCPVIERARGLANTFIGMLRQSLAETFENWIDQVKQSDITELQNFASGLLKDRAAVVAALSLPWSNGQVEGQVNRLKLIKRQMYGRASFTLLRARVLHPP